MSGTITNRSIVIVVGSQIASYGHVGGGTWTFDSPTIYPVGTCFDVRMFAIAEGGEPADQPVFDFVVDW